MFGNFVDRTDKFRSLALYQHASTP